MQTPSQKATKESAQQMIFDSEEDYLNETFWRIEPLYRMVEHGDIAALRGSSAIRLDRYDFRERIPDDERKQIEYMAVSLVNTFMIAAIQGGTYPPEANWIADRALRRLMHIKEASEISSIIQDAAMQLCEKVYDSKQDSTGDPRVEAARNYILTHLTQEISVSDIAGAAGLSQYYLSRLFKEKTGMTMKEYLTDKRIETARELLESDSRSIPEIAALLRFCDQSHFTFCFRKKTGMTPGQYRMAHRKI